jgi:hypothetical protein
MIQFTVDGQSYVVQRQLVVKANDGRTFELVRLAYVEEDPTNNNMVILLGNQLEMFPGYQMTHWLNLPVKRSDFETALKKIGIEEFTTSIERINQKLVEEV